MNKEAFLKALAEIKELSEKLKKAKVKVDLCNQILEEIAELEEILKKKEEDEIKSFRLLIVLIEKLKGLGDKVPLLGTFLELYIAALKSTLWLIDEVLAKHGWLHDTCMKYCKARAEAEERLRDLGYTDDEIEKDGHESGMLTVGWYQYEKYQKQFKEQYEDYRRKLEMKNLLKQAEELKKKKSSEEGEDTAEDEVGEDAEQKRKEWEKLFARFSAWLKMGEQIAKKIKKIREKLKKGNLSKKDRKQLVNELEHLEKLLAGIFG